MGSAAGPAGAAGAAGPAGAVSSTAIAGAPSRGGGPGAAGGDGDGTKAVVILVQGLDPELVVDGGALGALAEAGAFALVAQRTAGGDDVASAALTAGSGVPMTSAGLPVESGAPDQAFNAETMASAYSRRSGRGAAARLPETSAVSPAWFWLRALNAESPYRGRPGLLGESLRQAGMAAAVVSPEYPEPSGAGYLFAADADGVVAWAELGRHLAAADPMAPGGWRTDADRVAEAVARALAEPGVALVAVDSSDIARALSESTSVDDGARTARLQAAYHSLQELLEALTATLGGPSSDVGIFVLSLAAQDEPGLFLGVGAGIGQGLLSSATTRRPGLISLVDVAPTLLGILGVLPAWDPLGNPAAPADVRQGDRSTEEQWDVLLSTSRSITSQGRSRGPVLSVFIGSLVVAIALCIVAMLHPGHPRPLMDAAGLALASAAAAPAVLIVAPLFGVVDTAPLLALMFVASIGLGAATLALVRPSGGGAASAVEALASVTALVIAADALTGGALARSSVLGHSALIGARFYGVGNEFMGVLLGAALVGAAGLWRRASRLRGRPRGAVLVALAAVLVAALLGSPTHGSNFGGVLSAAAAACVAIWVGLPRRGRAAAALACIAALALVAAMVFVNAVSGSTHIGRAVRLASSAAGRRELAAIAARKMAVNLRLLRYTAWTRLLWALLAAVVVVASGRCRLTEGSPALAVERRVAVLAGVAAALAAMVANDSGVVACATAAMLPTFLMVGHTLDSSKAGR